MDNELFKAFSTMLWYQGYDYAIAKMIAKIKDTDTQISREEGKVFSEEVWSMFVLMFGDYGTAPRVGWIEKVAEFRAFLQKILNEWEKEQ